MTFAGINEETGHVGDHRDRLNSQDFGIEETKSSSEDQEFKQEMLNDSIHFLQTIDKLKHKKENIDDESQNTDNILGELQRRLSIEEQYENYVRIQSLA